MCWYRGRQHVLAVGPRDELDGPCYLSALKKFTEMLSLGRDYEDKDARPISVVCELFLRRCSTECRPKTLATYTDALSRFCDAVDPDGARPCSSLTVATVRDWLASTAQPRVNSRGQTCKWGRGMQGMAARSLRACFRWAVRDGLLTKNPIEGLRIPTSRSRGREYLIGATPAERAFNHARIVAAASKSFRPFIVCLEATGARPGEIAAATAADYNAEIGAICYHADAARLEGEFGHKTSGHGKERTIFLTGDARRIVEELVKKRPRGPLFRNTRGQPWTAAAVARAFYKIRRKTGIAKLSAYSYRHVFATDALEKGMDIDTLAALLGNSAATIRKHYAHLLANTGNLRRRMDELRGEGTETRTPPPPPSDTGAGS
jgi:site-specific recombinase XerD